MSSREIAAQAARACGHKTMNACPTRAKCFACCGCLAYEISLAKELHITYCEDIAEDGDDTTPWELPAEPEPLYFATFREALKGYIGLIDCERDQAVNALRAIEESRQP